MKLIRFILAAVTLSLLALPFRAMAITVYNTSITAIYGSGNPDTGWTADNSNGLTLALRAKGRNDTVYAGTTPNDSAGTYTFGTQTGARGPFNYEFSINSGTATLTSYDFYLAVDQDHSAGFTPVTVNPLTYWLDNSYGTGTTANGAGTETGLFPGATVAQNSQNITFGGYPGGALGLVPDATYTYELYAVQSGAGANGTRLASVSMNVVVGGGGAVPDIGSSALLLGIGLSGLMVLRKRLTRESDGSSMAAAA